MAGTLLVVLAVVGAPLWALIAVGGGIPLSVGFVSAVVVLVQHMSIRYERRAVSRGQFVAFSAYRATCSSEA